MNIEHEMSNVEVNGPEQGVVRSTLEILIERRERKLLECTVPEKE